jgi:hypothetical protein
MLPTFTPTATFTLTFTPTVPMTATPTRTHDQAMWLSQKPVDGVTFNPGQEFDMVWTIKNIGTNTWDKSYGYRFKSGTNPSDRDDYHLKTTVGVDTPVDLIVDMNAPREPGSYRTVWELYNDRGQSIYVFNFSFYVR